MKKGKLVIISGLSGEGKGTAVKSLVEKYEDVIISVSATTRDPRETEKNGVDYFFVTKEKFENMIQNNELLEYAQYVENYYGTPIAFVEEEREKGNNVVLEIEMQGALKVKDIVSDAVMIFILPPSAQALKDRLVNRGTDSPEVIRKRLIRAGEETKFVDMYEHHVINEENKLEKCVGDIRSIIDDIYDNEPDKEFIENIKNDIISLSKDLDI